MSKHGKTGTPMGVQYSPKKRSQMARRRKAQEKRWAKKSGPVVIIRPAEKT